MKLLLVGEDRTLSGDLFRYFTPLGYSVIHYTNPLKAMDNFSEIRPDIVVFNETDYPRHWKLAAQFLRENFSRVTSVFVLLVNKEFPREDLHKAHILGVNGLISMNDTGSFEMSDLESLILHYKPSPEVRKHHGLLPLGNRTMDFIFMNPENLQLVTARVLELSEKGAVIKPVEKVKTQGLSEGMEIPGCSLKTGDIILNLSIRILKINGVFELEFLEGSENWQRQVQKSINSYN